jgi:ribosomal protein L34E
MSNLDVSDECNAPVTPAVFARPKKKVVGRKPHRRVLSPAGTYRCPKCANEIIVFVRMSALPLCINHSASSGGAVSMEEVK